MVFIMKVREYISKKRAKVIIISILSSLPFIVLLKLFFDSGLFIILFLFFFVVIFGGLGGFVVWGGFVFIVFVGIDVGVWGGFGWIGWGGFLGR